MEFLPTGASSGMQKKGASTGGKPRVPVSYGQYEIGRSKNPSRKSPFTSPPFKDNMQQSVPLPPTGDPGAYDPYFYEDAGTNPAYNSSNKSRKPFDSTEVRALRANLFGLDTPSIGMYPVFQPEKTLGQLDDNMRYPKQDANVSVFRSGSMQRPTSRSAVPGAGAYTPNVHAIIPAVSDSGASMRGATDRFFDKRFENITDEVVGPGSYDQYEKTLAEDCDLAIQRSSKTQSGFGSTTAQRKLPFYAQDTPAPGCYEPMEPRLKELTGEARQQVL